MVTKEEIAESHPDVLFADGFDEAIIGITRRCGMEDVVAYDYSKAVEILIERDGMDYSEAVEYMEFNVVGGYVGEFTPIFIETEF